jgi:hypothetical protein
MGIEFGFLDDKSAGFQLEDTELLLAGRLNRLLSILALCSLWLLSIGTYVVDTEQRQLVDTHWTRGLSYLQLGWRWLDYCLARDAPLPLMFHLEPTPNPEPVVTPSRKDRADKCNPPERFSTHLKRYHPRPQKADLLNVLV